MVIKSWCRYFTGKFIRAWPAITLHAPDMNEKLWEKKRKLEDAYDRVMSELEDYSGSAYGGVTETIFALFEQFYRKVRMLALPVSGFSLVIGFLLLLLVRRDKLLFRRIFDIYCGNSGIFPPVYLGNRNIIKLEERTNL